MSQNFVIPILMLINRINLSLLKGTFYKRVLRRIRWFDSKSIINGMTCPSYQLLEIILTKINFLNSPDYLGIFFYLIFTIIISKILLIYLYLYPHADIREKINYIPKRNRNKNKDYVTYVVKGKDLTEEEINEHGLYDISIITKEESDFKSFAIYVDDFNPLFNEKMIKNAKRSLVEQNAGGSSDISEAWSIHHLSKKNKIKKCKCEMEVSYYINYKMMDYILINAKDSIGVSVVRALCYHNVEFSFEDGISLLNKKINGLVISRKSVSKIDSFNKSILHIWSPNKKTTNILQKCLKSDKFDAKKLCIIGTMDIWITTSNYSPIFTNGNNTKYKTNKRKINI